MDQIEFVKISMKLPMSKKYIKWKNNYYKCIACNKQKELYKQCFFYCASCEQIYYNLYE